MLPIQPLMFWQPVNLQQPLPSSSLAGEGFTEAVSQVQTYINTQYGPKITLSFQGSTPWVSSMGPRTVCVTDPQDIFLTKGTLDGEGDSFELAKIGTVLPAKQDRTTLKTYEEMAQEIQVLVDQEFANRSVFL